MADDNLMNQDDIERLLNQVKPGAGGEATAPAAGPSKPAAKPVADDDGSQMLGQNEIEKLLNLSGRAPSGGSGGAAVATATKSAPPAAAAGDDQGAIEPEDVAYLLTQAERALASIDSPQGDVPIGIASFRLEEFGGAPPSAEAATIDLVRDVELDLRIELGRTNMYLEDVLKLRRGAVVPLDKMAGDPVDIFVNGRLIARGEVLVLNDNFCVRVAELVTGTNVF